MTMPRQLNYPNTTPIALSATETLSAKLYPQGALPSSIQGNEWVTWTFQDERAFLDPYSLYVKFNVRINESDQPSFPSSTIGATVQPKFDSNDKIIEADSLSADFSGTGQVTAGGNLGMHLVPTWADATAKQLDGSAQSLISELSLSSNSEVIQRVYDYDMMAHIYRILGYDPWERINRRHEGLGGHDVPFIAKMHGPAQSVPSGTGKGIHSSYGNDVPQSYSTTSGRFVEGTRGVPSVGTTSFVNTVHPVVYPNQYTQPGSMNNFMNYSVNPNALGYNGDAAATTTYVAGLMNTAQQNRNYIVREMLGKDYSYTPQPDYFKNDYNTASFTATSTFDRGNQSQLLSLMNFPKFSGYECPYSPAFSYTCYEPVLSVNCPQKFIKYGYPEYKYRVYSDTFYVPLICLLGIEWQPEDYYLLPMWSFGRIDLQLRFNPNAFFCSHPLDNRKYSITSAELNYDAYIFNDDTTSTVRNTTDSGGIQLHHTTFKSVIRDESPGNSLKQYYQITEGVTSAKFLLFCWIPKDYESYSNCRKAFFINPLLGEYFVSLGNRVYPSKTVVGSATNRGTDNVHDMYVGSMKTFGKAWVRSQHNLGVANYALCNRMWDPAAVYSVETLSLSAATIAIVESTTSTLSSVPVGDAKSIRLPKLNNALNCKMNNTGTFGSMGYFHENRIVGTCLFGIDFETFDKDGGVMSGINTRNVGTFTLNLKQKITDYLTVNDDHLVGLPNTTLQMYAWLFIDQIVELHHGKIIVRQ